MTHTHRNIIFQQHGQQRRGVCVEDHIGKEIVVVENETGERVTLLPGDDWQIDNNQITIEACKTILRRNGWNDSDFATLDAFIQEASV